jgi:hypothetical protein
VTRVRGVVAASLAAVVVATGLTACQPPASPYDAAIFGDVPYSSDNIPSYVSMISDINAAGMAFSSHLGDIKARTTPCAESLLTTEAARFDTFTKPLVYTPGDNEWLDCTTDTPLFWLGRIRTVVFRGTGTLSRGVTPMTLTPQAADGYPENARWSRAAVTFATLHVVGGGDDQDEPEGEARRTAVIAWMRAAFAAARAAGHKGVVLLAQDSPFNGDGTVSSAYSDLMQALREETLAFSGQVIWFQGDGHRFIDDKPMMTTGGQVVQSFRRIQVEGDSRVSYVRLHVDPGASGSTLFTTTLSKRY